jgi:hypothetical protein
MLNQQKETEEAILKLVITEKKSVAEAIAKVLNANKREEGFFITEGNLLDTKKPYQLKTKDAMGTCDVLDTSSLNIKPAHLHFFLCASSFCP